MKSALRRLAAVVLFAAGVLVGAAGGGALVAFEASGWQSVSSFVVGMLCWTAAALFVGAAAAVNGDESP